MLREQHGFRFKGSVLIRENPWPFLLPQEEARLRWGYTVCDSTLSVPASTEADAAAGRFCPLEAVCSRTCSMLISSDSGCAPTSASLGSPGYSLPSWSYETGAASAGAASPSAGTASSPPFIAACMHSAMDSEILAVNSRIARN